MGVFDVRLILADRYDSTGSSLNQGFSPVLSNGGTAEIIDNGDGTLDVDITIEWSATQNVDYSIVRYVKAGISIALFNNDNEDIVTSYSGYAIGKSAMIDTPSIPNYIAFSYFHTGPDSSTGAHYSIVNPSTSAFDPSVIAFTHGNVPFTFYHLPEGYLNIYSDALMPYYNQFQDVAGKQTFQLHVKIPGRISGNVQLESWEPTSSASGILRFKQNGTTQRRCFTKAGSLWKPL